MTMNAFFGGVTESVGLYGDSSTYATTSVIEWFIFQSGPTQPATPTGGSIDFINETLTPPAGWSNYPPVSPTSLVWVSLALVSSKSGTIAWSAPGQMAFSGANIPGGIFGGTF